MDDELLAIILLILFFIVFMVAIGYTAHDIETQERILDCVNFAIHNNSNLSVTEAGRICMEKFK